MTEEDDPFTIGASYLNDFQLQVFDDCITKGSGGLSLPMGSGKTLLSILMALQMTDNLILIVVEKNLISSWIMEIKKFFNESLSYEILHRDFIRNLNTWNPKKETRIILTTPETLTKAYKEHHIHVKFIIEEQVSNIAIIKHYAVPNNPYLNNTTGLGFLYSQRWGVLLIDEAQQYTNINTFKAQALGALCCEKRWGLSGTLFNEPKLERILGYYIILNIPNFPRNYPEACMELSNPNYKGLSCTTVSRGFNEAFVPPKVHEHIISHSVNENEAKLYTTMKKTIATLHRRAQELRRAGDTVGQRKFSSYVLVMLVYLRQCLVCPLLPISSVAVDMADYKSKSELSTLLLDEIKELGLNDWLNDLESIRSSRIKEILKALNLLRKRKIVLFSCFRSFLKILQTFIPEKFNIFTITGSDSIKRREEIVAEFENIDRGILLLTFELGSCGLNLQCADTVLLTDFWWNASTTKQAIARVVRYGQQAQNIDIYFFTSNTGLEDALFHKQKAKLLALEELQTGSIKTKIPMIKVADIIKFINNEDNVSILKEINSM